MIDEETKTRVLIDETKAEIEQKNQTLASVTEALEAMEGYHVRQESRYPLWERKEKAVESFLQEEAAKTNRIQTLLLEAEHYAADKEKIASCVASCIAILKKVQELDAAHRYEDARKLIAAFPSDEFFAQKKEEYRSLAAIDELLAYEECFLYCHKGERNIALRRNPLEKEELERFLALAESLTTSFRSKQAKQALIDKARGFSYIVWGDELVHAPATKEVFDEAFARACEIRKEENEFSYVTKQRAAFFYQTLLEKFNALSKKAFDEDYNYDDALYYFRHRRFFHPYEIAHYAYVRPKDEREFRIYFLKEEAKRKTPESFAIEVGAYCDATRSEKDIEFDLLASYLAMDELSEEKEKYLVQSISAMTFEFQILLLAEATRRGMKEDRQALVLDLLENNKKKVCDLEYVAPSLAYCMDHLASVCQIRLEQIIKGLRRSPHAHKVRIKSNVPEVHALFDEDPTSFPEPWGKEAKNKVVKSWTRRKKGLYIVFGLLLPALLLSAAVPLLLFLPMDDQLRPYLLLIPLIGLLLETHLLICAAWGRDERGSAVLRRLLYLDALGQGALALCYILFPDYFSYLPFIMYTLLIFSAVEAVWAWLLLKDKKKIWTFILFLPAVAVDIASVVLLVMRLVG